MRQVKELCFIRAVKSRAVFSAFKHKRSTAGHCTEHICNAEAAAQLLALHFMSTWTAQVWHIEKVISKLIRAY